MFSFKLSKEEEREYFKKGIVARKGMLVFYPRPDGTRGVCENTGWTVYVFGKGYVRSYYETKYAALLSAESDIERADRDNLWGTDVTREKVESASPSSVVYGLYKSKLAHLENTLKKEEKLK